MKKFFIILFLFCFTGTVFANPFCIKEPLCVKEVEKGVYLVKINPKVYSVHTYGVKRLTTTEEVYKNNDFVAVLNGGYFDFTNTKTMSFVLKNEEIILDPLKNEHLSENEVLKQNIDLILNRGEFRIMDCNGETKYEILKHYDTVKDGCKIVDSLQAGPIIYPENKSNEEFFTKRNAEGKLVRDSIEVLKANKEDKEESTTNSSIHMVLNIFKNILASKMFGNKKAELDYALCCYFGYGIKHEYAQAFYIFSKLLKSGNKDVKYYLANCYYYGYGVEKNDVKAAVLYESAARNGNEKALRNLMKLRG